MAILTLESPVEFTETISPVCLPQKCMDVKFTGRSVTAMGWGLTKENGTVSDYLRSASFNVISKAKCSKHYDDLTDHMFCTYKEGQDTCQVSDYFLIIFSTQSEIKQSFGRFYRETAAAHWSPITEATVSIADSFRLESSATEMVYMRFFEFFLNLC
jgi:hypothetical protein